MTDDEIAKGEDDLFRLVEDKLPTILGVGAAQPQIATVTVALQNAIQKVKIDLKGGVGL